jgi:hypothetical protein
MQVTSICLPFLPCNELIADSNANDIGPSDTELTEIYIISKLVESQKLVVHELQFH